MNTNVVCLFADKAYYPLAYILAGRLAADPARSYDVIIFSDREDYPAPANVSLKYFNADERIPGKAHSSERITRAAYNRIFIADVLPGHYERAIYLDCDIAVPGDLNAFFAIDLRGFPIAVIADCGHVKRPRQDQNDAWDAYLRSVAIDPGLIYFNSGVFLADLAAWRKLEISAQGIAYLGEYGDRLTGMDQDTLNHIFQRNLLELSPRWNFQALYFDDDIEKIVQPAIYHHLDDVKPWHDLVYPDNRHARQFHDAFARSPWPGFIKQARRSKHYTRAIKRNLRRAVFFLPFARKRLEADKRRALQYRTLAVEQLYAGYSSGRYGDCNGEESAHIAVQLGALRAAPVAKT